MADMAGANPPSKIACCAAVNVSGKLKMEAPKLTCDRLKPRVLNRIDPLGPGAGEYRTSEDFVFV